MTTRGRNKGRSKKRGIMEGRRNNKEGEKEKNNTRLSTATLFQNNSSLSFHGI
jgi:hypothetical protein